MGLRDIEFLTIDDEPASLASYRDHAVLIVNVASKCGNTPQYEPLEELQRRYAGRGFTVLGFPCNQFKGQEPGTAEEIKEFCSSTYGVTFPLMAKIDVNGEGAHPLFEELTRTPDADGEAGPVGWNFEKFLVAPDDTVTRFRTKVQPDDPAVVEAIEAALPR